MLPEELKKIQSIFEVAVGLSPDQRSAFLDQACGNSPEHSVKNDADGSIRRHAGQRTGSTGAGLKRDMFTAGPQRQRRNVVPSSEGRPVRILFGLGLLTEQFFPAACLQEGLPTRA